MTQNEKVLRYMQNYGSITPLDALREFGCMRLAARIGELRKEHRIDAVTESALNREGEKVYFARYILRDGEKVV